MADPYYTSEKLGAAVQALAVGRGRIKERLNDALSGLVLVDPEVFNAEGMYREAPEFWRRIWSKLTAAQTGAPGETGAGPRSIEMMTEEEAASVAQSILSLDSMLDSYLEDHPKQ